MKQTIYNLQTGKTTTVDLTAEEIAVKQATSAEQAKVQYKRDSTFEYPSIGDQFDLLYKDLLAGKLDATGEWAKAVKKVKDDNPKP